MEGRVESFVFSEMKFTCAPVTLTPFSISHFFGAEFNKDANERVSFSTRIDQFCELYYCDVFTKPPKLSGNMITLMGMDFDFDVEKMLYKLDLPRVIVVSKFCEETMKHKNVERSIGREYDSISLICIGRSIIRSLHSINEKGFVSDDSLSQTFIMDIMLHLKSLNYSFNLFGNSELCYTM